MTKTAWFVPWDWKGAIIDAVIAGGISGLTLLLDNLRKTGQFPDAVGWAIVLVIFLLTFLISLQTSRQH